MPTRLIRDWTDWADVDLLSDGAEALLIRLIMKADDYGRFHASPRLIRSLCYPLRDDVSEAMIERRIGELFSAGLICVYKSSGRNYLRLNFVDWQKRSKSRFPGPPEDVIKTNVKDLRADCAQSAFCPVTDPNTNTTAPTDCFLPSEQQRKSPAAETPVHAADLAEAFRDAGIDPGAIASGAPTPGKSTRRPRLGNGRADTPREPDLPPECAISQPGPFIEDDELNNAIDNYTAAAGINGVGLFKTKQRALDMAAPDWCGRQAVIDALCAGAAAVPPWPARRVWSRAENSEVKAGWVERPGRRRREPPPTVSDDDIRRFTEEMRR